MKLIAKYKLAIAGIFIGALGGYAYYYFVGCASGSCPITSKPLNSTVYGALMGILLSTNFQKQKPDNKYDNTKNENNH